MVADDLTGVGPRVLADVQPVRDVVALAVRVDEAAGERRLEGLHERIAQTREREPRKRANLKAG